MKFEVGDRVVCTKEYEGNHLIAGKTGTVKEADYGRIAVEFDECIDGHGCVGTCKHGYGWWVHKSLLKAIPNNKIVITTDGKTTFARLCEVKKVIKSAQAICSPDDDFDFDYGARLAFDRLIGKEDKPEYYSGKVVCVEVTTANAFFTVGKVYEYKNGLIKADLNMSGDHYYNNYNPAKTRAEALGRAGVKFIEYKGENI